MLRLVHFLLSLALPAQFAASQVVLVTGATGGTSSIVYRLLKERGVSVRAVVRNRTKARAVLGCQACDASEGIWVADVTQEGAIAEAAKGATTLALLTGAVPDCSGPGGWPDGCSFYDGDDPEHVDWKAGLNQVKTWVEVNNGRLGHVVGLSSMGTTRPGEELDTVGDGWMGVYKLNFEAFLMASGAPFTIVKACVLTNEPSGTYALNVSGLDDYTGEIAGYLPREDAARVLAESVLHPELSANLRFDVCGIQGPPMTDFGQLLQTARSRTVL